MPKRPCVPTEIGVVASSSRICCVIASRNLSSMLPFSLPPLLNGSLEMSYINRFMFFSWC